MAPVQGCLGHNRDVCDTLNARKHGHGGRKEDDDHRYNPRQGRHCDSGEDRSWSPLSPSGSRVFN
jgi:hypothetical protein